MRRTIYLIIVSIIVFGLLTYFTADELLLVGGENFYGFPFTFWIIHSNSLRLGFIHIPDTIFYWKLILDILFSFLIGYIIIKIFRRLRPTRI